MALARKVVVTGVGVVSPIGIGKDPFWKSLCAGESGVHRIPQYAATDLPVPIGAELQEFEPKKYVRPRKSLKVMCREIRTGFAAATLATEDAGIAAESVDSDRFGVVFGSEMIYGELPELEEIYRNCLVDKKFVYARWGQRFPDDIFPLWMLKYLPNMVACHIGIAHDARGPNNTITLGEASSLLAITEATRIIERGHADVMIAGGAGNRLNITGMMYRGDSNLSHRSEDPPAASRPFEAHRDGMVNGEGAGALVLESYEHASARRAGILAQVLGCGGAFEPSYPLSLITGTAIRTAIQKALHDAELSASEIGHVNAHGLSTVHDDAVEAQAIRELLGDTPVTAPKSYFGNLGAGGGAVEIAASVLALANGQIPPTLNYEAPDPKCPVHVIHGGCADLGTPTAVVLNQSGTGQSSAIVIAAP
jgi:3-oxoacyl-[acyl-carrier-protein] synthase II